MINSCQWLRTLSGNKYDRPRLAWQYALLERRQKGSADYRLRKVASLWRAA